MLLDIKCSPALLFDVAQNQMSHDHLKKLWHEPKPFSTGGCATSSPSASLPGAAIWPGGPPLAAFPRSARLPGLLRGSSPARLGEAEIDLPLKDVHLGNLHLHLVAQLDNPPAAPTNQVIAIRVKVKKIFVDR